MICEKAAVRHFKKENIFEILNLADRFNAKNLKVENLSVHCFSGVVSVSVLPVRIFQMLAFFRAMC